MNALEQTNQETINETFYEGIFAIYSEWHNGDYLSWCSADELTWADREFQHWTARDEVNPLVEPDLDYNQFMINMLDDLYSGIIPAYRQDGLTSFENVVSEMEWRLDIDYPEIFLEYFHMTFDHFMSGEWEDDNLFDVHIGYGEYETQQAADQGAEQHDTQPAPTMPLISQLQVMKSQAGWYVGTGYREDFFDASMGWPLPNSRDSDYCSSEHDAQQLLALMSL